MGSDQSEFFSDFRIFFNLTIPLKTNLYIFWPYPTVLIYLNFLFRNLFLYRLFLIDTDSRIT